MFYYFLQVDRGRWPGAGEGRDLPSSLIYLGLILIIGVAIFFNVQKEKAEFKKDNSFHDSLDEEGKRIFSAIQNIRFDFERTAEYFNQNFRSAKSSSNLEFRQEQCKKYINDFRESKLKRDTDILQLKKMYPPAKVRKVLNHFYWVDYHVSPSDLRIVKERKQIYI